MKQLKLLIILLFMIGCTPISTPETTQEDVQEETIQKVSFLAVGDNILHDSLLNDAKENNTYDFTKYYENIKDDIQNADISFVNQESILGGSEYGYKGYPNFNSPDEIANTLNELGFDVVNGATNHAADFGDKAIQHSIQVFNQYDMKYIGLYENKEDKDQITVINKNDIKIAFLSYTIDMNLERTTELCKYFDKEVIKKDVEKAKEISDVIIVSAHWGVENSTKLNSIQKEYSQYLADLGVDVIIGTHPHVLQDITWIEGKNNHKTLVAYSLGNFISGMLEEDNQLGGMITFDIVKKNNKINIYNVSLIPIVNHYEVKNNLSVQNGRYNFKVYKLNDYTETLARQHGLNGYNNITISIDKMKEKVENLVDNDIKIED
jgi:poly-gamma-glutamate synthesis protein (capsule biosynthesis protein)